MSTPRPMQTPAIEPPPFFSPAWWDAAAERWNGGDTASMARFGTAVFHVRDGRAEPVWMHWDEVGRAARRASGRFDDPNFSAPLDNWLALFQGQFTAGMSVLRFKIRFSGPVRRVLPYTRGLNAFARAARP